MANPFPDGFLWGAATAAHQVEGNNTNSDIWLLEHLPETIFAEPSGDACDHYRQAERALARPRGTHSRASVGRRDGVASESRFARVPHRAPTIARCSDC
jgi:hypothetical protein